MCATKSASAKPRSSAEGSVTWSFPSSTRGMRCATRASLALVRLLDILGSLRAPSKQGGTLSKVPQLGTKKTPANHRHYRHDRLLGKEAAYPSRSLRVCSRIQTLPSYGFALCCLGRVPNCN